ncbi:MAG: hypothetical protein AAGB00_07185 [Planctomycetota bacterium]
MFRTTKNPAPRLMGLALLLAPAWAGAAAAATVDVALTLTQPTGSANRLVAFASNTFASGFDTIDLSGRVDARLDLALSPVGAQAQGIRFDGGPLAADQLDLSLTALFAPTVGYAASSLGGEVTTTPGGFTAVANGEFSGGDHWLQFTAGDVAVTENPATDRVIDLAQQPLGFAIGAGATVQLFEIGADGRQRTFGTTLTLPIDGAALLDQPSTLLELDGALVANGVFTIDLPPAGDFDGDGSVTAADYTVWRDAFAAGTAPASDYLVWRQNFGAPTPPAPGAVSNTPEPAALGLSLTALLLAALRQTGARPVG